MFEVSEDKSYINENECMNNNHLESNSIFKIIFDGREEAVIHEIKEYLEAHYKMYQYKKDNGVKYGEHELFYWANSDAPTYFTIDYNDNIPDERRTQIADEIIRYITKQYPDANGYIRLNYHTQFNWAAINAFIDKVDPDNMDDNEISVIGVAVNKANCCGNTMTIPNREKSSSIMNNVIKKYVDKNVKWSQPPFFGISTILYGKIKELPDGQYGFFEKRYRKRYYPVDLSMLCQFSLS